MRRSIILFLVFMVLLFAGSNISDSNTSAQTTEQVISQLALSEFHQNFDVAQRMNVVAENGTQYSDYEVNFIEVHEGWARIHILSSPEIEFTSDGVHNWPDFQGAVAREVNGLWTIYFEGTTEFDELKDDLPFWLSFLDVPQNQSQTVVSVPGLPWAMGETWRFTSGFHAGWALDFAPLQRNGQSVQGDVYALEGGEVVSRPIPNGVGQSCIYVKRGDGLIMMYQHVRSSDLDRFSVGNQISYGDYLGKTNYPSRDCAAPDNTAHHVHIEFRWVGSGTQGNAFNPTGSTMNGWLIASDDQLTKNGVSVTASQGTSENHTNEVYHDGCPGTDEYGWLDKAFLYLTRGCEGTGTIIREEDGKVVLTGIPGVDNTSASLFVPNGYAVKLWDTPLGQYSCVDGSLWDMSKDYFQGTNDTMYQAVSAIEMVPGTCADLSGDPNCASSGLQVILKEDGLNAASGSMCEAVQVPPPNVLPLPPGPQTGNGGGVKLYQYPNYEGELLYTFNVGFSNEPNAEGYSMQVPSGWSVITYREDNMQGMSECWNANVPNFQDHNDWQTKVQSIQIFNQDMCPTDPPNPTQPPNVQFFSGLNYQGSGPSYYTGFHDHQYFYADSLSLKTGSSVVLYRIDKRQSVNQAFCFNRSVPNLDAAGWPYQIVGLEVFNFDLCQDQLIETHDYILYQDEGVQFANCGGHGPTSAADLTNWCGGNWNDQISSLRIKAGWSIKVWEHANYQGGDKCFSTSMTTFRNDALSNGVSISVGEGDSVISSFAVFDNEYCDGSPEMPQSAWGYSNDNGNLALGQFVMSAEENDNQSITVEWEQSTDSSTQGYHIYEHVDDDFYALVATINSRYTTSWTFNDLPCGTDYHYLVKAFNNWGDSATPNLVAVSTPSCYVEPVWGGAIYLPLVMKPGNTQPPQEGPTPNAPSGLHVTTVGQNSITVAWDDNSTIEDNFEVWYQADGGQWVNPTVAANTESYTVSGLECETQYHFVVRAINWDNGNLYYSESNFVSANTNACDPVEGPTPNAPTDLHKTSSTTTSISVMWNDNSNIELEYRLGYKATTSADTFFVYLPANNETYTVTGLDCSLQYEIWVTALNTPYYAHSNNIYVYPSSCQ